MSLIRKIFVYTNACILTAVFLVSCHNSEYVVSKSSNHKPKFIEGIALGAHNKSNVMDNGIDNSYGYNTGSKLNNIPESAMDDIGIDNNRRNARIDPSITNTLTEKYAGMLGVLTKQITNYNLYQFIDEWYGVNYRIGGSTKTGIDCSAFVQRLYSEVFGVDLFRTAMEQFNNCIRLHNINEAIEGDLVFFHIHGRRISHVGIYLINDYFVHASRSQGIVISNLNDEYWHKYYACAGRLPKS
jgi:lipoprotein Spr